MLVSHDICFTALWKFFIFFIVLFGPHLQHMEVLRLGVESELQLLAYTIAMAMLDPSHICDLHLSLQQCQILNLLSKARDRTLILIDTSQVLNPLSHNGLSWKFFFRLNIRPVFFYFLSPHVNYNFTLSYITNLIFRYHFILTCLQNVFKI